MEAVIGLFDPVIIIKDPSFARTQILIFDLMPGMAAAPLLTIGDLLFVKLIFQMF
jgi:hypothetical protein